MIFNASAGTGKTWQVTELYCALVLGKDFEHLPSGRSPVPPEKILLMTFTDNAAAELRQRVSQKMAAEKDREDDIADLARQVLRKLPASNISTIHAFCASLLREHSLELGLSPVFQTLEDEERDALLEEVLKSEIFQCLENDPDFRAFCAGISILGDHDYSVINTIRSLLEKAASRGLDLSLAETMLPDSVPTIGKKDFQKVYDELSGRKLPAKAEKNFQTLDEILSDFPNIGKIRELTRFTGKGMKPISDALADVKDQFLTETLYAENVEKFRAFARCLATCARSFSEAKRVRDCVDFGDQLLLARDVLKGKKFDTSPFEWIIVDEVQDTSRVQCDVIEALWARDVHLVVCGDRKQSIYAWRSADPDVMPDLESAMAARGDYQQIPLVTSYRSKDRVIDAVNQLFSGVYGSYEALEPLETLNGESPCVEFLEADDDEQGSDEEMTAVARRIQLLVNGADEWRPKFGHNGQRFVEGQPFGYGDILILLKRSTHQAVLEKALRDAGIPYTSGGKGKALFEQQEVRDLLLFLQVMTQPQNHLALVGFLRSPFANVSDEDIVKLGWDGETFDHEILSKQFFGVVGQGCRSLQSLPHDNGASFSSVESLYSESLCDDTRSRVREARSTSVRDVAERILRYREQVGSTLPSQLVREIVRETAFDAYWAGQPGGEQKLANFKKALDWLRAAERGGQVLIGDVVRRFEKAIKTPPRSGAAEALLPDPEQNAVTIMTVHGAKGLTKRVCLVPDISFGDFNEPGFAMFSAEGMLEMNLSDLTGGKVASPGWKSAREADKQVREKESTNVFYVAMTRARDLVVFSGAGTQRVGGWMKLSEAFLSNAPNDILCRRKFADLPMVDCKERLVVPPADPPRRKTRNLELETRFQPLEIPKGIERKPVTALCEKKIVNQQSSIGNARRPKVVWNAGASGFGRACEK